MIGLDIASGNSYTNVKVGTQSITIGSGSNRYLLALFCSYDGSVQDSIISASYNGVAMTRLEQIKSPFSNHVSDAFGLVNPDSGTHDLSFTSEDAGSTDYVDATWISLTGVKQTGQPDAVASGSQLNQTNVNASITTVADNSLIASLANTVIEAITASSGGTEFYNTGWPRAVYSSKTPAGSVAHNYSNGNSDEDWIWISVSLAPATGETIVKDPIGGIIPFAR
jgi:hypothetical protein